MKRTRSLTGGSRLQAIALALVMLGGVAAVGAGASSTPASPAAGSGSPGTDASLSASAPLFVAPSGPRPPVLAYYYMWFNSASWVHAKTDLPALGGYTSTDPAVIRQQVTWAKQSGVDAFIVSWKSSPSLNLALQELVAEAHRQNLKLVLIYEGLDVNRNPISVQTVESDLVWFEKTYGDDPAFNLYGKPAVVWSGTWRFLDADIEMVRAAIGAPDRMLLLGSEKSAAAYGPRAGLLDGDAYYWSSADPLQTPGYALRLNQLGEAVHARGGLWLAPAAVGFDARLNGGSSTVDRRDGATLRAAWSDAVATGPEGVALISWNEYTENSYVEPSVTYGFRYLTVLSSLTGAAGPADTSIPSLSAESPSDEAVSGASANGSSGAAPGSTTQPPARPEPLQNSPGAVVFAIIVLALLALLGWRLRSTGRRDLVGPKEGR